jgi:hypothetical protein
MLSRFPLDRVGRGFQAGFGFNPPEFMKGMFSFVLLLLFTAPPAEGAVVVYRKSHSAKYIGQGGSVRIIGNGQVVVDAARLQGFNVTTFKISGQKFFTTQPFEEGTRFYTVTGPGGRVHNVTVGSAMTNKVSGFEDGVEFAIGVNATLAITPTNSVQLPRVFNFTGRAVAIPTGEAGFAVQGSGVASYSKTETRLANSLNETPADTLARYRASLISLGYQEQTE